VLPSGNAQRQEMLDTSATDRTAIGTGAEVAPRSLVYRQLACSGKPRGEHRT
jgi:hypothetical protein